MASRKLKLPIKCQVIGGQLASGKTSLILRLLATKPKDEVWAVLVNEAGAVGIDQALLSGGATSNSNAGGESTTGGVKIKMLGGGCLCCTLSSVTAASLVQLVRSSKPDRLIIEPSGLAHPKALLQMLQGPHLASALDLQPIVCLVDLSTFDPAAELDEGNSNFIAQVALCDVLIGTKADICGRQQQDEFISWALALQPRPAKILISTTSEMKYKDFSVVLDEAKAKLALDADKQKIEEKDQVEKHLSSLFSDGLFIQGEEKSKKVWLTNAPGTTELESLQDGDVVDTISQRKPLRKELSDAPGGTSTCGWIFHKDDVIKAAELEKFAIAAVAHILRLKGIFRIEGDKWVVISIGTGRRQPNIPATEQESGDGDSGGGGGGTVLQALDGIYHDSRVEIIVDSESSSAVTNPESELSEALRLKDWDAIENMLENLLVMPPLS